MTGLVHVPCSNADADADRGLFILRKIHTDQWSSLSHSTIVSLCLKFNSDPHTRCYDATLSEELISQSKKASTLSKTT